MSVSIYSVCACVRVHACAHACVCMLMANMHVCAYNYMAGGDMLMADPCKFMPCILCFDSCCRLNSSGRIGTHTHTHTHTQTHTHTHTHTPDRHLGRGEMCITTGMCTNTYILRLKLILRITFLAIRHKKRLVAIDSINHLFFHHDSFADTIQNITLQYFVQFDL